MNNELDTEISAGSSSDLAGLADRMNNLPKITVEQMTDYFMRKLLASKNIHIDSVIAKSFAGSLLQNRSKTYFLDTETTGLGDDAEIIEISIINGHGETILDTLIRPTKPVPKDALAIHGITNELLVDAPAWPDIVKTFERLFDQRELQLAIYNKEYDLRLLRQTYQAYDIGTEFVDRLEGITHCAMLTYADYYGEWDDAHNCYKWQKLTTAAMQCGISPTGAHRALVDAQITLGVIEYMATTSLSRRPYRASFDTKPPL